MYVRGIHFINHKINDYFPEGAALLNLPVSTLKEKRAIIHNYFKYYNQQDYDTKQPASTRGSGDVP